MKLIVIGILVITLAACGQSLKDSASPKEKFDAIEKLVGNNNWLILSAQDTGYMYFSRISDTKIRVYSYQLEKGDSTNTRMVEMALDKENYIYWPLDNARFKLVSINDSLTKWDNEDKQRGDRAIMQKFDSTHLLLTINSGKAWLLEKTLPLATFLVRSRYDYEHGTSYVDSPIVKPLPVINVK